MSPNHKILCVILGGGGHARVIVDCIEISGLALPYAILDSNPAMHGKEIFGVLIRGGDECIEALKKEGVTHFISGVGGARDNVPRQKVFEMGVAAGLVPLTLVHPSAILSRHAKIGKGTVVFAGSIVNPAATIGANCVINTGAIIEHDCVIGNHVHVATGAKLSGTVRVGEGAHIGAGAVIRNNIVIGEKAVVGAGSVVVKDVLPQTVVKGVPAR